MEQESNTIVRTGYVSSGSSDNSWTDLRLKRQYDRVYGPYCSLKVQLGSGPRLHGDWRDQGAEKLKEDKGRFYQHFFHNNFLGPQLTSQSQKCNQGRYQGSQLQGPTCDRFWLTRAGVANMLTQHTPLICHIDIEMDVVSCIQVVFLNV